MRVCCKPRRARAGSAADGGGSAYERHCASREQQLSETLKRALPGITYVSVEDISGGCGAMFEVFVFFQLIGFTDGKEQ